MMRSSDAIPDGRSGAVAGRRSGAAWAELVVFGCLVAGCGSVQVRYPDGHSEYQSRAAFEAYVERVFRYHNRVVNDLIVSTSLMDDAELKGDTALLQAEDAMATACRTVNEIVTAAIEGRELGLFQKLALPEAAPACEAATRRVEGLLGPMP